MKILFTILLVGIVGANLFPCNCPPPFPSLKKEKGDFNDFNNYRIQKSNIAGIVQIISTEERVQIVIDTVGCTKRYYDEIMAKNIDPKFTSLNIYLKEQSSLWKMRMYRAVRIKDFKTSSIGDTIYLFSDYSNCGIYFSKEQHYKIYGSEVENRKYVIESDSILRVRYTVPKKSCIISRCSAEYVDSEKFEK
nr:hypothetical protein [Chitinophagaceae bacterium]